MSIDEFVIGDEAFNCGIQKKIISGGTKKVDLIDGSKVFR
jgi:hypothetical protein